MFFGLLTTMPAATSDYWPPRPIHSLLEDVPRHLLDGLL